MTEHSRLAPSIRTASILAIVAASAVLGLRAEAVAGGAANDNFPGTSFSTVPYEESLDTTGATVEPDEPLSDCGPWDATVWWTFTTPQNATYIVEVTSDGSFAPLFAVWEESTFPGGGLVDIACGGFPQFFPDDPIEERARANFPGEAGKTYYIQTGGLGFFGEFQAEGPVTFRMTRAESPANDNFAEAVVIGSLPFDHEVDYTGATTEPDEPQAPCFDDPFFDVQLGTTVWYRYTAPQDGHLLVDLLESAAFPTAIVWTGEPGDLSNIACGFLLGFAVEAGETYYLQIGELYDNDFPLVGGVVNTHIEPLFIPICPAESQTFSDPAGDTFNSEARALGEGQFSADVVGVRAATDSETTCLIFSFATSLPESDGADDEFAEVLVFLDTDSNPNTGAVVEPDPLSPCAAQGTVGAEALIFGAYSGSLIGLLLPIGFSPAGLPGFDIDYVVVTTAGDSMTVAMATDDIGGDGSFGFIGGTFSAHDGDCLPNTGIYSVSGPLETLFGDLDCDDTITSRDNQALLREVLDQASLPQTEPCADIGQTVMIDGTLRVFGDLDCDGELTSRDNQAELRVVLDQNPLGQMEPCPDIGTQVTVEVSAARPAVTDSGSGESVSVGDGQLSRLSRKSDLSSGPLRWR